MDSTESDREKCDLVQGFEILFRRRVTAEETDDVFNEKFIHTNHEEEFPFE
jgi:hypothetical protein